MAKLKVPSLQHLARNWRESPNEVSKGLVRLVRNPPTFSYAQISGFVTDLLVLHQPLDSVIKAVQIGIKRAQVRENFLELLPLIDGYFKEVRPQFVQSVTGRMFPIARDLMVPFNPPLIYGASGRLTFPWFSYWRTNPLADKRLALFVSVVFQILKQDADLDDSDFHILDFSATGNCNPRELRVIDARDVPLLPESEIKEMLAIFAEGYFIAERHLNSQTTSSKGLALLAPDRDDSQIDLFEPE